MAEAKVPGGGVRGGAKKAAAAKGGKATRTRAGVNTRDAQPEVAFKGHLVTVRLQPVTRPDGREALFEVVEHPDAVAIVAVRYEPTAGGTARPLVALVHQPRPVIGRDDSLEIPAGLVDADERGNPEHTATRELREETGYEAGRLRLLTKEYSSPGFTDEALYIYLATELRPAAGDHTPDPSEIAKLDWVPLAEAMRLCREGRVDDSKTLIGLWLARDELMADAFGR